MLFRRYLRFTALGAVVLAFAISLFVSFTRSFLVEDRIAGERLVFGDGSGADARHDPTIVPGPHRWVSRVPVDGL